MADKEIINEISGQLEKVGLLVSNNCSDEDFIVNLSATINSLIANNFSRLVSILYTLDISEQKLRIAFIDAGQKMAGEIIAAMIIERQIQKIKARSFFKSHTDIPEEDKW